MSALAASGLTFAYGNHVVLRDVSVAPFQIGSLSALIGPNASGKSNLLKLIAGCSSPAQVRSGCTVPTLLRSPRGLA